MKSEFFESRALDDLIDFRNGKAISPEKYVIDGAYPVYGANGQLASSDEVLNEEAAVVIGRVGAYCGSVYYVPQPSWVTDNAIVATAKQGSDLRFLYFLLKALDLQRTAIGSAQPLITQGGLKVIRTPIPPFKVQQAIACILGALDDKIDLNRRMNRTLESMARAIFQDWFVDFDPVRAKAAGQAPAGLKPEIAALFPDRLVEVEGAEIPSGWRLIGLNETGTFLNGLALQKYPAGDGDSLPVIKIAQLRKGNVEGADRASTELDNAYIVNDGDVLFSWSGSLECVLWTGGKGALNQHLFKVTSDQFPKWFYYLWIHAYLPSFRHIAAGKATTMGHIQRHHLSDARVVVPPLPLLTRMDQDLAPMIDAFVSRAIESRILASIRDTLLPKLISGELRVLDAERILGRAA